MADSESYQVSNMTAIIAALLACAVCLAFSFALAGIVKLID